MQISCCICPKYRRQIIYGRVRADIGKILREICERIGVEVLEAECCKDHIHMLISIQPKYSVSYVMGALKWKSVLMMFERYINLKYRNGNRNFRFIGVLCRCSRKKYKENTRIHTKSIKEDYT